MVPDVLGQNLKRRRERGQQLTIGNACSLVEFKELSEGGGRCIDPRGPFIYSLSTHSLQVAQLTQHSMLGRR